MSLPAPSLLVPWSPCLASFRFASRSLSTLQFEWERSWALDCFYPPNTSFARVPPKSFRYWLPTERTLLNIERSEIGPSWEWQTPRYCLVLNHYSSLCCFKSTWKIRIEMERLTKYPYAFLSRATSFVLMTQCIFLKLEVLFLKWAVS